MWAGWLAYSFGYHKKPTADEWAMAIFLSIFISGVWPISLIILFLMEHRWKVSWIGKVIKLFVYVPRGKRP